MNSQFDGLNLREWWNLHNLRHQLVNQVLFKHSAEPHWQGKNIKAMNLRLHLILINAVSKLPTGFNLNLCLSVKLEKFLLT